MGIEVRCDGFDNTRIVSYISWIFMLCFSAVCASVDGLIRPDFFTVWGCVYNRICRLVCSRYVDAEADIDRQAGSIQGHRRFSLLLHAAYTPVIISAVREVVEFSRGQFSRNVKWLVPLLSQLILCDDKSIRTHVSNIYMRHINSNILVAMIHQQS